jgi:glycosyltransferase involved in cell wall biosynthesis
LDVPPDVAWELCVVDNRSTDHTETVVREAAAWLPVRYIREDTIGVSFARNRIVAEATGEAILWTDDDVLVEPNWARVLIQTFNDTGAHWVFGRAEAAWPDGKTPGWFSPKIAGLFALLDYGPSPFVATDVARPFYGLNFSGLRQSHRELGGFRTDFGPRGDRGGGGTAEDTDLNDRALAGGMKIVYQPAALVRHMISRARVTPRFHRRKMLHEQGPFYVALQAQRGTEPWLLGLPRWYFSKALGDGVEFLKASARGNRGDRFYYEMQVMRFVGIFGESLKHNLGRRGA